MIEIYTAVSPAVKKYIAHSHDINPFVVSRSNIFGIFLHNCLAKINAKTVTDDDGNKFIYLKGNPGKALDLRIYNQRLMLSLSEDLYARKGWYIHPQKQYDFNRLVELMIERDMVTYVELQTQVGSAKMDWAFMEFRDIFHFSEDDLTLKTMQKRYERYRKRVNA